MAISAKQVKELRESTGAGMLDCKNALVEADGDFDNAVTVLRKKGLSKAAKKTDRIATEGTISILVSDDNKKSTLVEINSETDFVAKTDEFISLVSNVVNLIQKENPSNVNELNKLQIEGTTFNDYLGSKIGTIGENIVVRRFENIICGDGEITNGYCHVNGKVGVLLKAKSNQSNDLTSDLLKNISMHGAAMSPRFLSPDDIPESEIEKERNFAKEELRKLNKPEGVWDKILMGKIAKYKNENSLLGQDYVMDNKNKVANFVKEFGKKENVEISISSYNRLELGEGLEKKEEDFAKEVAEQLG